MPRQTPSQTVGPFFSHALAPAGSDAPSALANRIRDPDAPGAAIRIEGLVLDGAGDPVPDALLEIWQAGAPFRGFGRAATDENGAYWFLTVKPGAPAAGGAPHVSVAVFARGMLNHAFTRLYFSDDRAAHAADGVLARVEPDRRETLVARRLPGEGVPTYRFTIRLQGERETVFFDA